LRDALNIKFRGKDVPSFENGDLNDCTFSDPNIEQELAKSLRTHSKKEHREKLQERE
jgi:hypothetical protein